MNLPEVKAIVENFKGLDSLVAQAKVCWQENTLRIQRLKIKVQYECLVQLLEVMESTKYTIKKRCKQSKNLTSGKTIAALTVTLKKECKTMTFLK